MCQRFRGGSTVFFILSKLAGLLLTPSSLMVTLLAIGLLLWRFRPAWRAGPRLAAWAGAALAVAAILPVGAYLLRPLERRFPAFHDCPVPMQLGGIILLGGSTGTLSIAGNIEEDLNDASDRVRYAAQLAKSHPELKILVSGGNVYQLPGRPTEAAVMTHVLQDFGVEPSRLILEDGSRTTAENARLSAASARAAGGGRPWLLVTSAFHMPRSVGTFRAAGVAVVAAPTDWRVGDALSWIGSTSAANLFDLDIAVKEYLGLLAYRLSGRSTEFFPGPDQNSAACASGTSPGIER